MERGARDVKAVQLPTVETQLAGFETGECTTRGYFGRETEIMLCARGGIVIPQVEDHAVRERMLTKHLERRREGIGREPVVGIEHGDERCLDMLKRQVARYGMATVVRRLKNEDARVGSSAALEERECMIGGTVVHADRLKIGHRLLDERIETTVER